jgi:hypothetical protein
MNSIVSPAGIDDSLSTRESYIPAELEVSLWGRKNLEPEILTNVLRRVKIPGSSFLRPLEGNL